MYIASPLFYCIIRQSIWSIAVSKILSRLSGVVYCPSVVLFVYLAIHPVYRFNRYFIRFIRQRIVLVLFYPIIRHSILCIRVCDILSSLSGVVNCLSVVVSVYSAFHVVYRCYGLFIRLIRQCILLLCRSISSFGILTNLSVYPTVYPVYRQM